MRNRESVVDNLEKLYREELNRETKPNVSKSRLEFDFQRDQIYLEMLLDIRDILRVEKKSPGATDSLLEKAQKIRQVARLRK